MKKLVFFAFALVASLVVSLCGCSGTAANEDAHLTTATAVLVLNGYNMPVLQNAEAFVETPQDGDKTFIVVPDSTPSVTTLTWASKAENKTYAAAEEKKWKKTLYDELNAVRPDSADSDLFSALLIAGDQLQASDTQEHRLVILCNGINTTTLNFAEPSFWSADTDEMISRLTTLQYVQPELFKDVTVTWIYMTSTDGVHQQALTPAMQTHLYAFWNAYLQACGAENVEFKKDYLTGASASGVPEIQTVPVEAVNVSLDAPATEEAASLTLDTTELAFQPDSAAFLNEEQANKTLDAAAAQLRETDRHFLVAGSVAATENSNAEISMRLSVDRAQAVKTALVERGVPEEAITDCIGLSTFQTPLRCAMEEDNRAVYIVDASTDLAQTLLNIGKS